MISEISSGRSCMRPSMAFPLLRVPLDMKASEFGERFQVWF